MLLLLIGILCLGGAAFVVAELMTVPARERAESFGRAARYGRKRMRSKEEAVSLRERTLVPILEKTARLVLRLNPKMSLEAVSFRLLSAGLGRRISPTAFLAAKGITGIAGAAVGIFLGTTSKGLGIGVLFGAAACAIGYLAPDFWVNSRIRRRQEAISSALPDALDLLAVSVEAGLGFDAAVAKLTEQLEGPLAEEFALTIGEMRIGESRQEALRKLSERVGLPEVTGFCRAIQQADQFGISLGRILRVQAVDTRNRRQMAAEEKAMKAPVKMLFPTVLFIFPAMFIVILGPAFLNLGKVLNF